MDKLDLILKELKNLKERIVKIESSLIYPAYLLDPSHDPILVDTVNFIRKRNKIKASDLQRKFDIGYARSARILDELMDLGFIDKSDDGKSVKTIIKAKFRKLQPPTAKNAIKDPLLLKAIDIVEQFDNASASLLQRRLAIGYARACKLLDELESHGYVGPAIGSLPRNVTKHSNEKN